MLELFRSDLSSPSNKVRFVANALGVPFQYKRVNLRKGEQRTPEFLSVNPIGKVPAIRDGEFNLGESNAIIRYLADSTNSPLYPKELKERAVVDQWLDFISLHVSISMGKVLFNRVFYKVTGDTIDERSLSDGIRFLERFLKVVDQQLGESPFIAGAERSLADFALLAALDPAEVSGISLAEYPNIQRWRAPLQKEEFYTKCYAKYKTTCSLTHSNPHSGELSELGLRCMDTVHGHCEPRAMKIDEAAVRSRYLSELLCDQI